MAEAIFRQMVDESGLADQFFIDSAGTGEWHIGELPDPRTRRVADQMGCPTFQRARQVRSSDFEEFDHIIAMDDSNLENLHRWPGARPEKVSLMLSWDPDAKLREVPDPYYGEGDGFVRMYEMLVPACRGLLDAMTAE